MLFVKSLLQRMKLPVLQHPFYREDLGAVGLHGKIVHDFTGRPFNSTVQAPQLVVSQPMCVPVSPRTSRIKCTSSIRGFDLRFPGLAIELDADALLLEPSFSSACPLHCATERTPRELRDQTLLVFRRTAQIRTGVRLSPPQVAPASFKLAASSFLPRRNSSACVACRGTGPALVRPIPARSHLPSSRSG